jgi:hypothetical protein
LRTFDLAKSCLFVKPFWVTLFHDVQRRVDEDLDKVEICFFMDLAGESTIGAVGRNERRQRDARCVCK